ncbi:carboxypeptidase-like regulatory domain-containing protein [uncultured Croceitalea sp.]|uniref:carboxypeptidase-like regulatory domain-containing protein n=1 Tax=uncultured Croceitalea sp. TaxID=1798908 RepID=UPI003305DBD4
MSKVGVFVIVLLIGVCMGFTQSTASKFEAGFTTIHFVDSSRYYKPETAIGHKLHYRPIDLDMWYPTKQSTGRQLQFKDMFQLFEKRASEYQEETDYTGLTRELATFYVSQLGTDADPEKLLSIKTDSYLDSKPDMKSFPLVLYMAGFNGMGFENYRVLENLAESGYIVVSISSIGRYPGDMTNEMVDTMEQVFDAESALAFLRTSGYFKIDFSTIGVLGCSWGGMASAILANRNRNISAMVSFDGTETHYFGETDTNVYANDAKAEDNDNFIRKIYDSNALDTENQKASYLYFESGNKLDGFTPTAEYHYYKRLQSDKYYVRFTNSEHSNFVCIPAMLNYNDNAVAIYEHLENTTVAFFDWHLKGNRKSFDACWSHLKLLETTTNSPFDISAKKESKFLGFSGKIIDQKSKKPLPYVNIGVLNREVGTVSDTNGKFDLSINNDFLNDTIRISMIGYRPVTFLMAKIQHNKEIVIEMKEEVSELNEVVVTARVFKERTLGNKSESKFISTGFNYDQLGAEMGVKVNVRKNPTFVDTFNFHVSYNRLSAKSIFRLNFYNVKNGRPHENILNDNILIEVSPKETGPFSVDLKPYDIILQDDVIIALEWVAIEGENKEEEAIFFSLGMLTKGTLYKKSSQAKFKKYSSMGVGFNIDVRF